MPEFRKKPVVIEAFQVPLDGEPYSEEMMEFLKQCNHDFDPGDGALLKLLIHTLEGTMEAKSGDWIIKGVKGEFYPCKPDIFAATYEPASKDSSKPLKETSSRISSIAARCVSFPETATQAEIKSMAASCLSQDETKGN